MAGPFVPPDVLNGLQATIVMPDNSSPDDLKEVAGVPAELFDNDPVPDRGKMDQRLGKEGRAEQDALIERLRGGSTVKRDAALKSQAEVHYQAKASMPGHDCGHCVHFIAPNACQIVKPPVDAGGWCEDWKAKGSE